MGLGQKDKKVLDSIINEEVEKIPGLIRNLRLPDFKDMFQIKEEFDYVYGYTHGSIVGKFETYYFVAHSGNKPTGIEVDEIAKTIFSRSSEIRKAIIKIV